MAETELERDQAKHMLTFVYGAYKSILEAADDKNVSSRDIDELLKLNQIFRDKLIAIRDKKHNI
jgi:hypothetical protein